MPFNRSTASTDAPARYLRRSAANAVRSIGDRAKPVLLILAELGMPVAAESRIGHAIGLPTIDHVQEQVFLLTQQAPGHVAGKDADLGADRVLAIKPLQNLDAPVPPPGPAAGGP